MFTERESATPRNILHRRVTTPRRKNVDGRQNTVKEAVRGAYKGK